MLEQIVELIRKGQLAEAAPLIREAVQKGEDLCGMNVTFAHVLLLAADWDSIASLLPKDTLFFSTSGWLNSLVQNRPVNHRNEPLPWFTYPAIDFLDAVVAKDWRVFEWGAGNSTLWWAARVREVVSIEDKQDWYAEISAAIPDNAHLQCKSAGEYARSIDEYPDQSFDVIVIDGSQRNECAGHAIDKLKASGILVFDNSDGLDYRQGQQLLIDAGFFRIDFWGLIPSYLYRNCTSVFFRDAGILKRTAIPAAHQSSLGVSCSQAVDRLQGKKL